MSKLLALLRVLCDVGIIASLLFAFYALHKWCEPYRRGFFCGDESLGYPYREGSIGVVTLVSTTLVVPGVIIITNELCRLLPPRTKATTKTQPTKSSDYQIIYRFKRCYTQMAYYLFGLAVTVLCIEMAKYCVGRLRPHFFVVCQPLLADGTTCSDVGNHGRYIEDYTCTAKNSTARLLRQLGQSFPSGHSGLMFYTMVYTSIYLQAALNAHVSKLFKHVLQYVLVMTAWYVALTRIAEFWHHWSDVLAGMVLGIACAFLIAICVADVFGSRGRNVNKPQVKPAGSSSSASSKPSTPVLCAHNYGSSAYLVDAQRFAQSYQNYGYVP